MSNAVLYEIIRKSDDEVIPVSRLGSGDEDHDGDMDFIVHMPEGEAVIFTNPGYENEEFLVRQRGSKMSPDNKEVVREDLDSVPFVQEGGANTEAGVIDGNATGEQVSESAE